MQVSLNYLVYLLVRFTSRFTVAELTELHKSNGAEGSQSEPVSVKFKSHLSLLSNPFLSFLLPSFYSFLYDWILIVASY